MDYSLELQLTKAYGMKAASCKDRGIPFELSFLQFKKLMLTKKCHYTGVPLILQIGSPPTQSFPNRVTIDRKDASSGYTASNSVTCSWAFNAWKNTALEQYNLEGKGLSLHQVTDGLLRLAGASGSWR